MFLDEPASIATWFGAVRRVETDREGVRVALRGRSEMFEVTEQWLPDDDALYWWARSGPFELEGYLTMREVLRGVGPWGEFLRGVQVWIHIESERRPRVVPMWQVAAHVATSGIQNLRAEFGGP